jgi:hypothetical protein
MTVRVPNIFDRIFAMLKGLFTSREHVEIQTALLRKVSAR